MFLEWPGVSPGKWLELGFALGLGKTVIYVEDASQPKGSVFKSHPDVLKVADIGKAAIILETYPPNQTPPEARVRPDFV